MENVSSSNGIEKYPKLRFPGFEEEWKIDYIESLSSYIKGASLSKADISENGTPFILYGELYTTYKEVATNIKRKTQRIVDEQYYSKVCDVIIPTSGESPEEIATATCVMLPGVILAGDLNIFRTQNIDGRFFSYIVNHKINNEISRMAQGRSVVHIKGEEISKIQIKYPDSREQNKILTFLELLASKIDKQEQLIEMLKKYKRGVVKGILVRQIRFIDANGNNYPEWKTCTLQNAVEFLDGQRKPLESANRAKRQGKYPYYGASGIIDYINDYIFDEPLLLLGEDGANILNRSTPLCFIAEGKYWVNNHAHVMRPKNGNDIKFLCELLESLDYTRYNTGTAQPKLNQEKCCNIELCLPVYEEQHHIATFLSFFDEKVDQEQRELERMFEFKKELLQQLFI